MSFFTRGRGRPRDVRHGCRRAWARSWALALARLPTETLDVLVYVAALARPTAELVAESYGDRDRVLASLEVARREGIIVLDDARLRFAHPLLASVCYEQTPVWKRRAAHRSLASAVVDSEERARHLALAADGPDADAACQLESAAERAAARERPPRPRSCRSSRPS